jgi:L-lactate dehydrogenase complex protein LldG
MSLDTSKARAAILHRIRTSQHRSGSGSTAEREQIDDYLARHPAGPLPAPVADLKARFRAMAERMASTVDEVERRADAPAAAARYLASQGLTASAVVWPALADLDWAAAGIAAAARAPKRDESDGADLVGITGCFCALAETGTLVLLSGPKTHASTHLLPETHIAVVSASRIVATMEDAFELLRRERGGVDAMMPRAINMVSGPSRTGDIEQTIVLGAHGPYRVHVVIVTAEGR